MDVLTREKLLRRTFNLARLAKNRGNGAFGAILARGSTVLFEGENTVTEGKGDLTCHAEMNVLREASLVYEKDDFSEFTLYCSTEPCAMCAGAAFYCGVGSIVYGYGAADYARQKGGGLSMGCRQVFESGEGRSVEVMGPLLEEEAAAVHQ